MSNGKGYYIYCRHVQGHYVYISEEHKKDGCELWRPSFNVLEALEYESKTALKVIEKLNDPVFVPAHLAYGLRLPWKMTAATHGASLPKNIRELLGDTGA